MDVQAYLMRVANARLDRAAIKLQTGLKLALSRQGRVNFGTGQKTDGPLGKGTVSTLPRNQRGRIMEGLKAGRGVFQGMTGRFNAKGSLLGLVQRSAPGEPPLMQSGRLRNSVSWRRMGQFVRRIGTNVPYGPILEFGRKGSKVIVAKGRSLYDSVSRRFFGKRVVQGPMKPRPWMRPTVNRMRGETMATLAGAA